MESIILNTKSLPVLLWDKIQTRQVKVLEQKGVTTKEFCKQKQIDKELE
jgi:hypothetical protein